MTTVETAAPLARSDIHARHGGFVSDTLAVAGRGLRSIMREPEFVAPAIIIPVFFFFVNVGALQPITESNSGNSFDYKAFALPA